MSSRFTLAQLMAVPDPDWPRFPQVRLAVRPSKVRYRPGLTARPTIAFRW